MRVITAVLPTSTLISEAYGDVDGRLLLSEYHEYWGFPIL
jgi:hypothetical protein